MRKQSKSIISMILSAAMVLSLGAGSFTVNSGKASAEDETPISTTFNAYLCQNNSGIFDSVESFTETDGDVTLKEDGIVASCAAISTTGEVTLEGTAVAATSNLFEGGSYLGVEFGLLGYTKTADNKKNYNAPTDFTIKSKEIRIKHADGSADTVLAWNAPLYNNSNKITQPLRISIFNTYVDEGSEEEYQNANPFATLQGGAWTVNQDPVPVAVGDTFSVTFEVTAEKPTITPTPVPTAEPTAPPAAKSYNAYMGFQTDNYIFRDAWNNAKTGLNGKDKDFSKDKYLNYVTISTNSKYKYTKATIKDTEVKENDVTYTVSISGANLKAIKGDESDAKNATAFRMLYVSTDIPVSMKGVTAVNATLKIDGQVVKSGFALPHKADVKDYYQFMVADGYSLSDETKGVAYPQTKEDDALTALTTLPTSSMEISFTLKGVDFSKQEIGVAKGKTFNSGNFKYKVTTVATKSDKTTTQGKVTLIGLTKKGKKAKKLSVPTKVSKKVSGVTASYKVTKLGNGAFKNAKKLKSVTLGKTIKAIPKDAFKKCVKLNKLTLKAKVSVKKNAFKGCKKTIKVSGTAKKANLKKLKKSGYKKFK